MNRNEREMWCDRVEGDEKWKREWMSGRESVKKKKEGARLGCPKQQ